MSSESLWHHPSKDNNCDIFGFKFDKLQGWMWYQTHFLVQNSTFSIFFFFFSYEFSLLIWNFRQAYKLNFVLRSFQWNIVCITRLRLTIIWRKNFWHFCKKRKEKAKCLIVIWWFHDIGTVSNCFEGNLIILILSRSDY